MTPFWTPSGIDMLNHIIKGIHTAVRVFVWIGACASVITVLMIFINVVGRFLFRQPLTGTIEIVEIMTVVLVYSVLPYTELHKRHVQVELVVSLFPARARALVASILCLAGTLFFFTMGWQACKLTWANLSPTVLVTDTLSIPFAPFVLVIAVGSLLLGLEMLINAFNSYPMKKDKEGNH